MRPRLFLRLLLAIVDAGWWLAPPSRRRQWRRQWRADILHEWHWLNRRPLGAADRATLLARTAGALHHAWWLRFHVRRLEMITQDLRYGWRLMVRRPAFTAIAIVTLGLAIGANVTIYSWVQALLLRPIPAVADLDRLASLSTTTRTRSDLSVSWPNFVDLRLRRPASVDDLIAYAMVPLNLRTGSEPERVWGLLVSENYFEVLKLRPTLGRWFNPADRVPEGDPVAVFSYSCWQRHFAGDPAIVGRGVTLNGRPFFVVGIAPDRDADPPVRQPAGGGQRHRFGQLRGDDRGAGAGCAACDLSTRTPRLPHRSAAGASQRITGRCQAQSDGSGPRCRGDDSVSILV